MTDLRIIYCVENADDLPEDGEGIFFRTARFGWFAGRFERSIHYPETPGRWRFISSNGRTWFRVDEGIVTHWIRQPQDFELLQNATLQNATPGAQPG